MLEYNRDISFRDKVLDILSTILVNMIVIIMATKSYATICTLPIKKIHHF